MRRDLQYDPILYFFAYPNLDKPELKRSLSPRRKAAKKKDNLNLCALATRLPCGLREIFLPK